MDKKIALAAALAASFAGSALAADLPSKKAPVAAPPVMSWTGFYVGANAGGAWSGNNSGSLQVFGGTPALSAIPVGRKVFNSYGGFLGGGQVGYNYQLMQSFVIGAEADIQGFAGSASAANFTGVSSSAGTTYTTVGKASSNLQYLGTVRGRVGYLVMPTLLAYGTAGFAYGGVSSTVSLATGGTNGSGGGTSIAYSNTQAGWTAGGGVEWMFLPNWSAKAEYLYYSLSNGYASGGVIDTNTGSWGYGIGASRSYNGNIVRAGVNYHFNFAPAPVVAKY